MDELYDRDGTFRIFLDISDLKFLFSLIRVTPLADFFFFFVN